MNIKKRVVDLSPVDPQDRAYIRAIIVRVLRYEETMPSLTVKIYATPDHYNVCFIGWDQIEDIKFYETFLKTDGIGKRDPVFDPIISTATTVNANIVALDNESDDRIVGPFKLFRIKRLAPNDRKYRK